MKTVFWYLEKNLDQDEKDKEFELWTVFPIVTFWKSETRILSELGMFPWWALSMHYVEENSYHSIEVQKVDKETAGMYVDSDSEFNF